MTDHYCYYTAKKLILIKLAQELPVYIRHVLILVICGIKVNTN